MTVNQIEFKDRLSKKVQFQIEFFLEDFFVEKWFDDFLHFFEVIL